MWRKGTAFQAKGTASRKVLRLKGTRHILEPERKCVCSNSDQSGQGMTRCGMRQRQG